MIKFKVGDIVYDSHIRQTGKVIEIIHIDKYIIKVNFGNHKFYYTIDDESWTDEDMILCKVKPTNRSSSFNNDKKEISQKIIKDNKLSNLLTFKETDILLF